MQSSVWDRVIVALIVVGVVVALLCDAGARVIVGVAVLVCVALALGYYWGWYDGEEGRW